MPLWRELRRRSIFKVGITYAITAWLLIQVASLIFPQLGLPAWAPTLVTGLLIVGFPIALLLAWAYELTPDGIRRTYAEPGDNTSSTVSTRSQQLNFWMTGVLGLAVLFMAIDNYWLRDSNRSNGDAETTAGIVDPVSFFIDAPPGSQFTLPTMNPHPALSADGRQLAFIAPPSTGERRGLSEDSLHILWLQRVGELQARPLPGTDGALFPFWSPDGRYVAYGAEANGNSTLNRFSVAGAAPDSFAEAEGYWGGSWSDDGTIIFGSTDGIYSVPSEGGDPTQVTWLAAAEADNAHRFPEFLPDGRRFIYLIVDPDPETQGLYIGSLDSAPDDRRRLTASDSNGTFAIGPDGRTYLLYVRNLALVAQAFDPVSAELSGEPRTVAGPIQPGQSGRFAPFAANGRYLVYRPRVKPNTSLTWFDRRGTPDGTIDLDGWTVAYPTLSRDGSKLAFVRNGDTSDSIWWLDLDRPGIQERLTPESTSYLGPQWSSAGDRVYYTRFDDEGGWDIFSKSLSAQQAEVPVYEIDNYNLLRDVSLDDRNVIFSDGADIRVALAGGAGRAIPVVQSEASEIHGRISPDGKWIAYSSTVPEEKSEIYVTSFPLAGDPVRISPAGGLDPQWRDDGNELYYISEDRMLMAVEISSGKPSGQPESLYRIEPEPYSVRFGSVYSPMPGGQRFLVNESIDANPVRLQTMMNWSFER
ncbi:MAG: hypothetical protein PVH89_04085 [Gammaproteobacteria bacterium]|jgi:Tol biopolymer transport system component